MSYMPIYASRVHKLSENCFEIKPGALFTACLRDLEVSFAHELKAVWDREREESLTLNPSSVLSHPD